MAKKMSKAAAHMWIHSWSLVHGVTASATAKTLDGGQAILTAETITAVLSFSKACGASWSKSFVESFVKQQLANKIGIMISQQVIGKIPGAGEVYNGIASAGITEAILWETYARC